MTKKSTLLAFTLLFSIFISFEAITNSSGSPAGRSGSPASVGTCAAAGCHNGPSGTSETITITTDIPASGFVENADYNITITADDGGRNLTRMGFQASVESAAGAEGSLTASGSDVKTVGAGNFVTHTSNGISAPGGSLSWTFVWNSGTAPDQTTIYTAVNFANSNGTTSGDVIETQQLVLSKDMGVSIAEAELHPTSLFPNPAQEYIQFDGSDKLEGELRIFDLKGQLIKQVSRDQLAGKISLNDIRDGVYIVSDDAGYTEYLHVLR
jgi:hypothetical protein